LIAFGTQGILHMMPRAAVHADHVPDGILFPVHENLVD
jgi:hypothetical protein